MARRALLLALLVALPQLARAVPVHLSLGEIEATTENDFVAPDHGSAPVWIELHSRSQIARTITLRFVPFRSGNQVTRTVALEAGERRTVSLPVPDVMRYGQLEVRDEKGKLLGTEQIGITPREGMSTLLVLGTDAQLTPFVPAGTPGRESAVFLSAKRMPDLLAAYRGFRAVVLLDPVDTLERSQRAAIEQYALTGGTVVFTGTVLEGRAALDTWQSNGQSTEPLGFGTVRRCVSTDGCASTMRALLSPPTAPEPAGARLLAGVGEPPLGAFLFIIIVFALAIGPGNLLLARRRGRHLMLITIPAFAFTTCAGIAGYGIASDGLFTVHEETRGASILDAEGKRAATVGALGLYAALAPSELRYPASTAARIDDAADELSIDWSEGLVFRSGFVPSRSYRTRHLSSVAPSRARLSVQGGQVQNALGAKVKSGIARLNGRLVRFADVPSDGAAPLSETRSSDDEKAVEHEVDAALGEQLARDQIARITAPLQDGEFLALLTDDAGFLPTGGLKPQRHASLHAVRGRIAP